MENTELKNHLKQLEKKLAVIYGFGLLAIITLALCSNFILKEQAARQATSLIKRMVEQGNNRETLYTLNDAKLDFFDAVVYYSDDGGRVFSLPAELDPEFAKKTDFLSELLYSRLSIDLFFDQRGEHKIGSVLFVFGRFSHVPYAVFIWLFFIVSTMPLVRSSRRRVTEDYNKHMLLCEEASRADLARRVRHDIRSPLGALQIATQSMEGLSQKQRAIIQRATERISEIVSELELIRISEKKDQSASNIPSTQSILTIAQDIVQEKRTQLAYKSKVQINPEFSQDSFFLFSKVCGSEFKRTLSNVIDNAIEACDGSGRITVRVAGTDGSVLVDVVDSGKGISPEDLSHVTEKGFTRKPSGSGYGLHYAKKNVEESGGTLSIQSQLGAGTSVSIRLPSCEPPVWYVPSINIPANGEVIILDDQESTHLSWKMRLDELKANGAAFNVTCFKSAAALLAWHHERVDAHVKSLYLLDYDLGDGEETGLDVAARLSLTDNAILVTGHFDSEDIQRRCANQRIGLVPKSYLSQIQFQAI